MHPEEQKSSPINNSEVFDSYFGDFGRESGKFMTNHDGHELLLTCRPTEHVQIFVQVKCMTANLEGYSDIGNVFSFITFQLQR